MKFVVDGMLGKLARWLRLAGHDVSYIGDDKLPPREQDNTLLKRAELEQRTLLTSDLALHRRAVKNRVRSTFVRKIDVVPQLVEISNRIGRRMELNPENSRCPVCNGVLRMADKVKIKGLVPKSVVKVHREFWRCTKCAKTYWRGSHWKTIIQMASRYNRMVK